MRFLKHFLEELSHGFQYKDLGPIKAAQSLNKLLAERKLIECNFFITSKLIVKKNILLKF